MRYTLFLVLLFKITSSIAQNTGPTPYKLSADASFVIRIKAIAQVASASLECPSTKYQQQALYHIKVSDVLFVAPNSVYDSVALSRLAYLSVPRKKMGKLPIDEELLITATFSTSKQYITFSRLLPSLPDNITFDTPYAQFTGLFSCSNQKPDPFDRYIEAQQGNR